MMMFLVPVLVIAALSMNSARAFIPGFIEDHRDFITLLMLAILVINAFMNRN